MYRGFPREPYGLWDHTALLAHFSTFFLQSIGKDAILWNALDNALFKSLLLTVIGKQPSNNICYPICFQKLKSHAGYRWGAKIKSPPPWQQNNQSQVTPEWYFRLERFTALDGPAGCGGSKEHAWERRPGMVQTFIHYKEVTPMTKVIAIANQ